MAVSPITGWLKDVVRSAPDVLRPDWLEQTWTGAHGRRDLFAQVETVHSTMYLDRRSVTGDARVEGRVFDGERVVGNLERRTALERGVSPSVHHYELLLGNDAQGTGFARPFNARAFERYGHAGVDRTTINAGSTVGGYAWARQGFELTAVGRDALTRTINRAHQVTQLVRDSRRAGTLSREAYAWFKPHLLPWRDAAVGPQHITTVRELSAGRWGRDVLLGAEWDGERAITTNGRTYLDTIGSGASDAAAGSRAIAAHLPPALDPHRAIPALQRELASFDARVFDTSRTKVALDGVPFASAHYDVRLGSGELLRLGVEGAAGTGQLRLAPDSTTAQTHGAEAALRALYGEWGLAA